MWLSSLEAEVLGLPQWEVILMQKNKAHMVMVAISVPSKWNVPHHSALQQVGLCMAAITASLQWVLVIHYFNAPGSGDWNEQERKQGRGKRAAADGKYSAAMGFEVDQPNYFRKCTWLTGLPKNTTTTEHNKSSNKNKALRRIFPTLG